MTEGKTSVQNKTGSTSLDDGSVTVESNLRLSLAALRSYGIVFFLAIVVALMAVADSAFLSPTNLSNILGQWAPAGIMAVAETYVIIGRGFDLSVASGFSLCAIAAAATAAAGYDVTIAFSAAIAVGLCIGFFNALLVCGLSINPFIATVGSGFIILGLDIIATPNAYITVEQPGFDFVGSGDWYGLPIKGIALICFLVLGQLFLAKSRYGRYLYAVGGNPEASRLSGLNVKIVAGATYVFSGFAMGVAGLLAASQLSSAQAQMEPTIVFDVIAVVVLGGTSLSGGVGSVWRTAVGLGIIAVISNGFILLGVKSHYQDIVKGIVIILAVALEEFARHSPKPRTVAPLGDATRKVDFAGTENA
jgi:ribose transport system permease protein